jgi:pyruvate dehydrogenase E2 component (dihydrolipoamide acetyltransferase)
MPRLSDSMEEGTILSWLKRDGEHVRVGEDLVEIETDKATMTYQAEADGKLAIAASEGETIPVGTSIARLVVADDATADPAAEFPQHGNVELVERQATFAVLRTARSLVSSAWWLRQAM